MNTSMSSFRSSTSPTIHSGALRGLAILAIFLHNYCHILNGIVPENEYSFVIDHPYRLLYQLLHPTLELPIHLVSFFGHYGVPLFLFLSAYGLERKYSASDKPVPVGKFIASHYAKLWVMMIIGFFPNLVLDVIRAETFWAPFTNVLPRLGLFNTLFPFEPYMVFPGPYWYFSLMVQAYVVYRLFLFRRTWHWAIGALVLCQLAQHLFTDNTSVLIWLRYNLIGSMLPFVLGLLYARYGRSVSRKQALLLLILSSVGIFLGSFTMPSWLWVPALVCIAGLSLMQLLPQAVINPLAWIGSISSAIFVSHPLTRRIIIYYFEDQHYLGLAIYTVVTILVAWALQPVINRATRWVAQRFA